MAEDTAAAKKWPLGAKLEITFADGARRAFTIGGIYSKTVFVSGLQAGLDEAAKLAGVKGVSTAFVTLAPRDRPAPRDRVHPAPVPADDAARVGAPGVSEGREPSCC